MAMQAWAVLIARQCARRSPLHQSRKPADQPIQLLERPEWLKLLLQAINIGLTGAQLVSHNLVFDNNQGLVVPAGDMSLLLKAEHVQPEISEAFAPSDIQSQLIRTAAIF